MIFIFERTVVHTVYADTAPVTRGE